MPFFHRLDNTLLEPLKLQGIITYFNGVNLRQARDLITITCKMYLDRVFERHGWTQIATASTAKTIPLTVDSTLIQELETTKGPSDLREQQVLEKEMGFSYRTAIGELICALITCQPDIRFATTKLSQYSIAPARCNYVAVKNVFRYLLATKEVGLTYWRKLPHNGLPDIPLPQPVTPMHEWKVNLDGSLHVSPFHGFVDSDWALDTTHIAGQSQDLPTCWQERLWCIRLGSNQQSRSVQPKMNL